jgi:hypothetical protein
VAYSGWVWPVELHLKDKRKPVISDGFSRTSRGGKGHYGVDIMYRRTMSGSPSLPSYTANYECRSGEVYVLACGPGTVWAVHPTDAHGISLEIDHHQVPGVGPRVSAYRHLDRCYVKAKDEVKAGQVIGIVGYDKTAPASQTPNHLHFELWDPSKQRIPGTDSRVAWGLDPAPVMALWGYRHREGGESTPPPQTDGQTDGAPPDSGLLTVAVLGVGAKVLLF